MSEPVTPSARAAKLRNEFFSADLTTSELAHILDLDETTVRRRLADGSLPGYRLGREWRCTEEALRRYVAQLKGGGKTTPYGVYPASGGTTFTWPAGTTVPSVTHPIGATVTYNAGGRDPVELDEP